MFIYCLPEDSGRYHEELRGIEEEIFASLGIPFRVVDTCTGDLGAPAYRKWDLGGLDARPQRRRVGRGDQHLQLHRLPGPPPERQVQGRRGQEPVRAHAQRHGHSLLARHRSHPGELTRRPTARCACPPPWCPTAASSASRPSDKRKAARCAPIIKKRWPRQEARPTFFLSPRRRAAGGRPYIPMRCCRVFRQSYFSPSFSQEMRRLIVRRRCWTCP
jgi:hypothetical protein